MADYSKPKAATESVATKSVHWKCRLGFHQWWIDKQYLMTCAGHCGRCGKRMVAANDVGVGVVRSWYE